MQSALTVAQATQVTETATPALIPKPRGMSGRGDFNLANAMGMEIPVYHEIQASIRLFPSSAPLLTVCTGLCPVACEDVGH